MHHLQLDYGRQRVKMENSQSKIVAETKEALEKLEITKPTAKANGNKVSKCCFNCPYIALQPFVVPLTSNQKNNGEKQEIEMRFVKKFCVKCFV